MLAFSSWLWYNIPINNLDELLVNLTEINLYNIEINSNIVQHIINCPSDKIENLLFINKFGIQNNNLNLFDNLTKYIDNVNRHKLNTNNIQFNLFINNDLNYDIDITDISYNLYNYSTDKSRLYALEDEVNPKILDLVSEQQLELDD